MGSYYPKSVNMCLINFTEILKENFNRSQKLIKYFIFSSYNFTSKDGCLKSCGVLGFVKITFNIFHKVNKEL